MVEEHNRIFALLKFDRDQLIAWLREFFDFDSSEGTYTYDLIRVKSAFGLGTMTTEDFEELSEDRIAELADFILYKLKET